MNSRAVAARVLEQVIVQGRSLSSALPAGMQKKLDTRDKALVQEICYGVLRWYFRLNVLLPQLLNKPIKPKEQDIRCLLLAGLYQLIYMQVPAHSAVSETVEAVAGLKKKWAKGLVNAVLREFQRNSEELLTQVDRQEEAVFAHPAWLIQRIKEAWPDHWVQVLHANNQRPPLSLRINARQLQRDAFLQQLARQEITALPLAFTTHGVVLEKPVDVKLLPGFDAGWFSVQDSAAQLAAQLLDARPAERILDACAAPGGKTCHILESQPALGEMVAVDIDEQRLSRIRENLNRLGLDATLIVGDASQPQAWWDGELFDRILLDAPCSATGVIRRHPDIKLLRHPPDITALVETQKKILIALWPLLKPGGRLLYVTCSILPVENEGQIAAFLENHQDAGRVVLQAQSEQLKTGLRQSEQFQTDPGQWGHDVGVGRQILPDENKMDGFYYACLEKIEKI